MFLSQKNQSPKKSFLLFVANGLDITALNHFSHISFLSFKNATYFSDGETSSVGSRCQVIYLHNLREGLHLHLRPQQTPQRSLWIETVQMYRLRLQVFSHDFIVRV
jgi:hypothetical protein